jgi:hypothetical protein
LIVGDSVEIDLQRIFAESSETQEWLQVVAYSALKAALVVNFSTNQQS